MKTYIYDKISSFLNPKRFESLSYLDVTTANTSRRVTDKSELESELIHHHQQHFSQATQTPFASKQVFTRLGQAADTAYAHAFYNGDRT